MIDINDLQKQLTELPGKIRIAGTAYLENEDKVKTAELEYNVALSVATLKSQETNATRQKADAIVKTKVEKKNLLSAELELAKAENELKYLENRYITMRKLAQLESDMIRSNVSGN